MKGVRMAFVDKETFEIFTFVIEEEKDQYFECDELIAPTIRLLNLKGYTTKYCCQSHPYAGITDGHIVAKEKPDSLPIAGIFYLEECKNLPQDVFKSFEKEIKSGSKVFKFKGTTKPAYVDQAYIVFEEDCVPPTVPEGWELSQGIDLNTFVCALDEWDFFEQRLEMMKLLKDWAESLPVKN